MADGARSRPGRAAAAAAGAAVALVLGSAGCADPDAGPDRSPGGASSPAVSAPASPGAGELPADVATGLAAPWGLAFLPDGSALVTVRDTAQVLHVARGRAPQEVGVVPGVRHGGEGGLLGIAVPDSFEDDGTVLVYVTTPDDNRVLRLRLDPDAPGSGASVAGVVLQGIPRAGNHNCGRIAVGPDGFLYVATGDAGNPGSAQDPASLAGKVLRVTLDGDPAPGNPFPGSPVWTWGHRNVQGLAWDGRGRLFASEFGAGQWDELNLLEAGGNYGWPVVEGPGGTSRGFVDPLVRWRPSDASPSGVAVVGEAVYVAALRGESLWRLPLTGGLGVVGEPERLLLGAHGRLRDVVAGPDGGLWLLTSNTSRGRPRPGDDRVLVVDPAALA